MKPLLTTLLALSCVAGASGQMEKRWSGLFQLSKYEREAPAVGKDAPPLPLFDLDGRPRSLDLEVGRHVVLLAGSFT